ncbi:zinc ribbon domain-containing protein, partial [Candidatus Saccharibacteria bacterium]|nr:zinc ribbon domain-containing protein [Candidatus Saccharibacteria bacterium]
MKKCEKCGTENADDIMYCTACGNQLTVAPATSAPAAPVAAPVTPVAPAAPAPAKKPVDVKSIALIAAAVIGLAVGVVGIVLAITSGNKKAETPTPAPAVNITAEEPEDDVTTANISGNQTGTAVKVGPFTLTIPKDFPFEADGDRVIFTDPTNSIWAANIIYDDSATYAQVSKGLKSLASYFESEGAKVLKTGTDTAGGLNYLYIDMTDVDGFSKTFAIFKANDESIFDVIVTDGTANHALLDAVAPIIANAKEGKTSNREIGFGITTKGVDAVKLDGIFDNLENSEE